MRFMWDVVDVYVAESCICVPLVLVMFTTVHSTHSVRYDLTSGEPTSPKCSAANSAPETEFDRSK